jgi:hypothetical protein
MSAKDTLISQSPTQVDNYEVKPSSFPSSGSAQSASGKDELCRLSENQCSPRHTQDDGDLTPSNWAKNVFTVGRSTAEEGKNLSDPNSVDLATGKITVGGYSATRVGEVGDRNARIPSR